MHMCLVFPMCISVFPLYSHYRMDELLVPFYADTLPLPISILLLIFRSHPLVYSSLPLPLITCCTYHGVHCLYSYIDYLSLYIHLPQFLFISIFLRPYSIPFQPISILLLLHSVIIRFISFPIYLFLYMYRSVYHLITPYINLPILTSTLIYLNFTKNT